MYSKEISPNYTFISIGEEKEENLFLEFINIELNSPIFINREDSGNYLVRTEIVNLFKNKYELSLLLL